jgi:enoyl-CoA hydratase
MSVEPAAESSVPVEVNGEVVLARLVNPPANPLSPGVLEGLDAAADVVERQGARAFVIASGVPDFFAAGADIKHMESLDGGGFAAYGEQMRAVFDRIDNLDAVSIAAIDGLALGGGLELALACTLRVGSRRVGLGLPEIKLGLIPGAGGTQRLPRLAGRSRALDMLLTGRQIDGAEAYVVGLLDRLVADAAVEREAIGMARQLARYSVPALEATRRCVEVALTMDHAAGMAFEAAEEQALFEDGEASEGIAAFVGRRAPVFPSVVARG